MADVTISSLPQGTPSGSAIIPYSQGNTTYSARPSAIVAASSGSVLQMQFVPYVDRYDRLPVSRTVWQTLGPALSITTRVPNSKIFLTNNISVQVYNDNAYCLFSFLRNSTIEVTGGKDFGIVTRSGKTWSTYLGWDNMVVQFVDQPNVAANTTLTYHLAVKGRNLPSDPNNNLYQPTNVALNDNATGSLTHFIAMEVAA